MLIKGVEFVDVQFAISVIKFTSQGVAPCGVRDVDQSRDAWFLRAGTPLAEKPPINVNFLSHSLFDAGCAENQQEKHQCVCVWERVAFETLGCAHF